MRGHVKTILHYLFLVGLPVLGVWFLLQVGKTLEAPISVGGRWLVTAVDTPSNCPATRPSLAGDTLIISQSGLYLNVVRAQDLTTVLTGRIEETHITAQTASPSAITFAGDVDRLADPDVLTGILVIDGCTLPLTAVRQVNASTTTNTTGIH
jgi:hypothetical protein